MRKQIQSLWRNRVPMCIEVVLVPDCSHGNAGPCVGDVSWPTDRMGSLLLEQWTIQVLPKRYNTAWCNKGISNTVYLYTPFLHQDIESYYVMFNLFLQHFLLVKPVKYGHPCVQAKVSI